MEDVTREKYYSSYKRYFLENSFSISLTDQSINAWEGMGSEAVSKDNGSDELSLLKMHTINRLVS